MSILIDNCNANVLSFKIFENNLVGLTLSIWKTVFLLFNILQKN
jgi:hypothetical protein